MNRLLAAAFLLICAALLTGLAVILARPRWCWEPVAPGPRNPPMWYGDSWTEDWNDPAMDVYDELCRAPGCWATLGHDGPHREIDGTQWSSTGSPDSVTTNDGKRTCDLCLICVGCRVGHVHCRPCRCAATCTTDPESVTWSVYNGEGLFV